MSEAGNGAATSGNGSSAPTTPAPGVSTSTPTPKSGEGAVAVDARTAPPKFQPIERELPWNDGTKRKFRVEAEEELDRHLYNSAGFDKAQKKALELERKEQARKERLAKKDYSVLREEGFDPDAYFMERLQDELRKEQMKPEDRAREEHESRIKQAEARAQAAERKAREIEQQHLEEREWQQLQPRLGKAMQEAGMLDDTHAWEEVSRVAQDFLQAGVDAPPEAVIREAAARDKAKFDERLSKLTQQTAPSLWGKLPPEVRKVFGYLAAQEHIKAKTNIPPPSQPVPQQVSEEKRPEPATISERQWLRKLGR